MKFFHIPSLIILGGCIFCISEKHFEIPITLSVSQMERDLFMRKYQVTIHLNNLFQKAKQLDNG